MDSYKIVNVIIIILVFFVVFGIYSKGNVPKSKMENISPYVMLNALKNDNYNIAIVNVLGDKIPFFINCSGSKKRSLTKDQFNQYIENNDLSKLDLVILYCASWSCGAAQNYYDELYKKGLDMNKVYDYKGALHEWSLYSIVFPETYNIIHIDSSEKATNEELIELATSTKHTYLLKDEQKSKNAVIKKLSN